MTSATNEDVLPSRPSGHAALRRPLGWDLGRLGAEPVVLLLAAALVLRVVAACVVPLIPEEAYYWMYAKNPSLSYYDHPPMVAWVIRAGTTLFGDTQLGVRFGAGALMVASSLLMYRLGTMWFARRPAAWAAVLLQALPLYFGMGLVAPMDAALCFFWLTCLIGVSRPLQSGRPGGWYLAGAALGAALLTKYSAIFLAAGVLLAVVGRPRWRWHLRTVHPYLAVALGLALFSPVLAWNAMHDWASFRFQFVDRYARDQLNLRTPVEFLLVQVLVLTPLVLALVIFAASRLLARVRLRRDARGISGSVWFAVACAAPGLAAAAYTSLRSEVHINWTAPMYLSLLPAACALAAAHDRLLARRGRTAHRWEPGLAHTVAGSAAISIALLLYLLILQPRLRLWTTFGPWTDVATVVEEHEDRLEHETGREPRIVADGKYRLASVLAFYRIPIEADPREAVEFTTSQWLFGKDGLGYSYWSDHGDWVGSDVIYVTDSRRDDFLEEVRPWFESVEVVQDPRLQLGKGYRLAICHRLMARPATDTADVAAAGQP